MLGDGLEDAQRRALGVTAASEDEIIALAVNWQAEPELREAAQIVRQPGRDDNAPGARSASSTGSAWMPRSAHEHWPHWCEEFLTKEGLPRAVSGFRQQGGDATRIPIWRGLSSTECDRIIEVDRCMRMALRVAAVSAALLTLAAPVLRRLCRAQGSVRAARLRRPDRPHLAACWWILGPPGCCTSWMAGWITCCWTRCRTPHRRNGASRMR